MFEQCSARVPGRTPLHCAAKEGHAAVVERFLVAGASVDAVDNYGRGLRAGRVDSDSSQIRRNFSTLRIHSPGEFSPTSKA